MIRSSWCFIIFSVIFCDLHLLKLLDAKPCNEIIEDVYKNVIILRNVTKFHSYSKNGFLKNVSEHCISQIIFFKKTMTLTFGRNCLITCKDLMFENILTDSQSNCNNKFFNGHQNTYKLENIFIVLQLKKSDDYVNCSELRQTGNKLLCRFEKDATDSSSKINSIFFNGLLICTNEKGM